MLKDEEKLFVLAYIGKAGFNATEAVRQVWGDGASCKTYAWRLLQREDIQEAIRKAIAKRAANLEMSADDVLRDLIKIKARCMRKAEFDPDPAIRALALIGKHIGMFGEKPNGEKQEPFQIILPMAGQVLTAGMRDVTHGRYIEPTASEPVQDVPLLEPETGQRRDGESG